MPNDATMTCCGLGCHSAIDINQKSMLEILRNGHLGRINVGAFVAVIEQAVQFSLRFSLSALESNKAGDTLTGDWITAKVELNFPTAVATLANVALSLIAYR